MSPTRTRLRYFTPAEANALLPEASRILEEATTRVRRFQQLTNAVRNGMTANAEARQEAMREADAARREARELLEDLAERGVELKGLEEGLLDFPAIHNGVEVCLCWQRGESEVTHWHPTHTGFSGRQLIEDLDEGKWAWYN